MPIKVPANGNTSWVTTFAKQIKLGESINYLITYYLKLILVSDFILRHHIEKIYTAIKNFVNFVVKTLKKQLKVKQILIQFLGNRKNRQDHLYKISLQTNKLL